MPRTADTPLRCALCGAREDAITRDGPQASGAENKRRGRPAYHVRCTACGHDWFSVTARAKLLSKTRDEEAKQARFDRKQGKAGTRIPVGSFDATGSGEGAEA